MKKWKKNLKAVPAGLLGLAVILIAASLAATPNAFAQGTPPSDDSAGPPYGTGMGKGGPGTGLGGGPIKGLFEILDDSQKEKVTAILEAHREDAEAAREKMKAEREALSDLIKNDATEAEVMAKVEELGAMQTEQLKAKTSMMLEIRALLTDEQKQQFDDSMDNMGPGGPGGPGGPDGKRGKGGGRGMGGGPGFGGPRDGSCIYR